MAILLWTVIVLWLLSGIGLVIMVMLHSGKGTGVSEMLASTINQTMGTAIVEKNLDRITVILAIIFIVTILVMMIIYPH